MGKGQVRDQTGQDEELNNICILSIDVEQKFNVLALEF